MIYLATYIVGFLIAAFLVWTISSSRRALGESDYQHRIRTTPLWDLLAAPAPVCLSCGGRGEELCGPCAGKGERPSEAGVGLSELCPFCHGRETNGSRCKTCDGLVHHISGHEWLCRIYLRDRIGKMGDEDPARVFCPDCDVPMARTDTLPTPTSSFPFSQLWLAARTHECPACGAVFARRYACDGPRAGADNPPETLAPKTCATCASRNDCDHAFDEYNTRGDCLADK